jgi:hypothetical protein
MPINTEKFQVTIVLNELDGSRNKKKLIAFDSEEQRDGFLKKCNRHVLYDYWSYSYGLTFLELSDGSLINYSHIVRIEKGNV